MLLCIDIGNSATHFGVFDGDDLVEESRVYTAEAQRPPEWLAARGIRAAAISSVAPSRTAAVRDAVAAITGRRPFVIGQDLPAPIRVELPEPEAVGTDRLMAALAAWGRMRTACVVVDVGTAVTVDAVSASGAFLGGAIAPGPNMMLASLDENAEKLPRIAIERPKRAIGRDTREAMRSGAYWGALGLIERLVREVRRELSPSAKVVGTGGRIALLADHLTEVDAIVPALTLEGILHALRAVEA